LAAWLGYLILLRKPCYLVALILNIIKVTLDLLPPPKDMASAVALILNIIKETLDLLPPPKDMASAVALILNNKETLDLLPRSVDT
jgi:hypothetical protein